MSPKSRSFDHIFGTEFFDTVPDLPGVYRFYDAKGVVIYVGKAKSLRTRLGTYRRVSRPGAKRRRAQRKMVRIVAASTRLDFDICDSEHDARIRELELIRELDPKLNVEGTYWHLYPAIGFGRFDVQAATLGRDSSEHDLVSTPVALLAFTTEPEIYDHLDLEWFGKFRSRARSKETFDALLKLFAILGHREKRADLPEVPRHFGSRLIGFRQFSSEFDKPIREYLAGQESTLVALLARELLEKPAARRDGEEIETLLRCCASFFQTDLKKLAEALCRNDIEGTYIEADEVDAVLSLALVSAGSATSAVPGHVL